MPKPSILINSAPHRRRLRRCRQSVFARQQWSHALFVNVVIKKDVLHIIVQWDPQRFPWLRDVLHLLPMVVVVPNRKDGFGENEVQNFWIGSHFIRKRFWVGCTQIASQAILPQVPGSTTPLGGESYGIHSQPKMVSQLKSLSLPLSRYDIIYYLEWPLVLYLS